MIHFVTWKWGQPGFKTATYNHEHVNIMAAMIKRHCPLPHRTICVTDDPDFVTIPTYKLWDDLSQLRNASGQHLPSCYRRLKLFDEETQRALDIPAGDRVCSIDIDALVVDDLTPLLTKQDPFLGWLVPGTKHPKVINGSMWMFTAGEEYQWMWNGFKADRSPAEAHAAGFFGSDQSYMSHQLAYVQSTGGWTAADGVMSYPRDVRAQRRLPAHARIVFFHGKRKPWDTHTRLESRWIEKYWRL
jgi:hypothetical protein